MNDSDEEIAAASDWMIEELGPSVPWHFSAFHPDYKMRDISRTSAAILTRAREIAKSRGIEYVYTGNVRDEHGGSTWCVECGARVIGRSGYDLIDWKLESGHCVHCGTQIPGHFDQSPGDWGSRRVPVRLADFG